MAKFLKTALIAINQLPVTEDTLWLRVLGKRGTQKQAIDELVALPQQNPYRQTILQILANWRITINESDNLSEQDRELLMNLSPAYLKWQEETLEQGRVEGQRQMAENFLRVRFGELDPELASAIAPMLQLHSQELTPLLTTLSHEQLLERFAPNINDE